MTQSEFSTQPTPSSPDSYARLQEYGQVKGLVTEALRKEGDILGIGSFALGRGQVVCVDSYISWDEDQPRDDFAVEGSTLIHRRPHAPMQANADLIGMWDATHTDSAEVALYTISAPFRLDEQTEAPFLATTTRLLNLIYGNDYGSYELLHSDMLEGTALSQRNTNYSSPHLEIRPTPETVIEQEQYGSLDDADGLSVRLYGPAQLSLPKDQYLVVRDTGVFQGPSENQVLPLDIEEARAFSFRVSVAKGGRIERDEAGDMVYPAPWQENKAAKNPAMATYKALLNGVEALARLGSVPTLVETTSDFLGKTLRSRLMEAMPLDLEDSRRRILDAAREAVQAYIAPGADVGHRLLGSADVSAWLVKRLKEGPHTNIDLKKYLERISAPNL